MKAFAGINLALIFSMILWGGSQAMGQTAVSGNPPSVSTPTPSEKFFIKAGAGTYLFQFFSTSYDRFVRNGIVPEIDNQIISVTGLTGSAAAGIDCPDHFSFFASVEGLSKDWSIMANAQCMDTDFKFMKPYIYFGAGLDFINYSAIGPGVQSGLGLSFPLDLKTEIFIEGKIYGAMNLWSGPYHYDAPYRWADFYVPLLGGLKFTL